MKDSTSSPAGAGWRICAALLLGAAALAAGTYAAQNFCSRNPSLLESAPWIRGPANHTGILVASFTVILILSRGKAAAYGLRVPTSFPLGQIALLSCGVSALFNLTLKFLPTEGLLFLRDYSFVQKIIFVWIYASVAEELLTRGLVQSFLAPLAERRYAFGRLRISLPVIVAALFFGAMHLALLAMGVDAYTVILVVICALALGLVAGHFREKTGSLVPAIVAHSLANVTGTAIGMLWGS